MKLLIITQKVDKNDPILGFFHRWIIEFAKHCESIVVICLEKGTYELPANVRLLSLGKEKGKSRVKYLKNFYKYIWSERKNYDVVFVHMNQEYVLLGGLIWHLLRKNIYMWRNHVRGGMPTRLAVLFSNKVFCTSKQSFTARFKKSLIMPVGIDTDLFTPNSKSFKSKGSILYLGRIAPIKNIEMIIESIAELKKDGELIRLTIVGNSTPTDSWYYKSLKKMVLRMNLVDVVEFRPAVPNYHAVNYYISNEIFINATPAGSADKTIFEAMSCGTIVVVSNEEMINNVSFGGYVFNKSNGLAPVLKTILNMNDSERESISRYLHSYVINKHSLNILITKLIMEMKDVSDLQK